MWLERGETNTNDPPPYPLALGSYPLGSISIDNATSNDAEVIHAQQLV